MTHVEVNRWHKCVYAFIHVSLPVCMYICTASYVCVCVHSLGIRYSACHTSDISADLVVLGLRNFLGKAEQLRTDAADLEAARRKTGAREP